MSPSLMLSCWGKCSFRLFPHGLNFNVVLISEDFIRPNIIYTMKHCCCTSTPGSHLAFFPLQNRQHSWSTLPVRVLIMNYSLRVVMVGLRLGLLTCPKCHSMSCFWSALSRWWPCPFDVDCVVHDSKDLVSLLWRRARCTLCVCLLCCRLSKERV